MEKQMIANWPSRRRYYGTIYTDPPWHTVSWSGKGRDRCPDGSRLLAASGYSTMPFEDLAAMPVPALVAKNCRLFMWVIDTHLPQALALGKAWGFKYSTVAFVWAKRTTTDRCWHFGGGHATRKGAEQCLLFLRGNLNRRSKSVRQLIVASRYDEHSRKPDEIYGRVEHLVKGPYLELFARSTRPGWDAWGYEVGLFEGGRTVVAPPGLHAADGGRGIRDQQHVAI